MSAPPLENDQVQQVKREELSCESSEKDTCSIYVSILTVCLLCVVLSVPPSDASSSPLLRPGGGRRRPVPPGAWEGGTRRTSWTSCSKLPSTKLRAVPPAAHSGGDAGPVCAGSHLRLQAGQHDLPPLSEQHHHQVRQHPHEDSLSNSLHLQHKVWEQRPLLDHLWGSLCVRDLAVLPHPLLYRQHAGSHPHLSLLQDDSGQIQRRDINNIKQSTNWGI